MVEEDDVSPTKSPRASRRRFIEEDDLDELIHLQLESPRAPMPPSAPPPLEA